VFLGRVLLGDPDIYKNAYNLSITFYKEGYTPVLEIKALNCISDETLDLRVYERKHIKDVL